MDRLDELMMTAVNIKALKVLGAYTVPRSFGVYEIERHGNVGRRFRFGNHPVRLHELEREYGSCMTKAVFLKRDRAKALTEYFNSR